MITTKIDIETCVNKLPNKDLKSLESLTSTQLPSIGNKMNTILHKLDLCEKEFTRKDETLLVAQKRVANLEGILKSVGTIHLMKIKKGVNKQAFKNLKGGKESWILKENKIGSSEKSLEKDKPTTSNEKQVEEIKMLSEVHDPLINLEKCSLHDDTGIWPDLSRCSF